jgi:SOS-response transcriptional repressor LexA
LFDHQRLKAAVQASGKSQAAIAEEVDVSEKWLSNLATGKETNPQSDLVVRLAAAVGKPVSYLYGETPPLSSDDEAELLRFRDWIDDKLATIDARKEPNAILLTDEARKLKSIADKRIAPKRVMPREFERPGNQLILRALGDSMVPAGILANDTLYTESPVDTSESARSALGKIIACRVAGSIYVKRLATEHRRLFLLSAHPRYAPIKVDEKVDQFEILGIVIGRTGSIE